MSERERTPCPACGMPTPFAEEWGTVIPYKIDLCWEGGDAQCIEWQRERDTKTATHLAALERVAAAAHIVAKTHTICADGDAEHCILCSAIAALDQTVERGQ